VPYSQKYTPTDCFFGYSTTGIAKKESWTSISPVSFKLSYAEVLISTGEALQQKTTKGSY